MEFHSSSSVSQKSLRSFSAVSQQSLSLHFFRGQLLIAIKTEISDSIDTAPSEVEVEQTQTINEVSNE